MVIESLDLSSHEDCELRAEEIAHYTPPLDSTHKKLEPNTWELFSYGQGIHG